MKGALQQDTKRNLFFEDFYRVAVQNERYEDWSSVLVKLKKLFNSYEKDVIHYHEKEGVKVPRAYNSTASQGNFLEVLNMSLNGIVIWLYLAFNVVLLISLYLQFLSDTTWIEVLTVQANFQWSSPPALAFTRWNLI